MNSISNGLRRFFHESGLDFVAGDRLYFAAFSGRRSGSAITFSMRRQRG
jgi:hypothetical protein